MRKFIISLLILIIAIPVCVYLLKVVTTNRQPQAQQNPITAQRQPQTFTIAQEGKSNLANFPATRLPQFLISLADQKFSNLLTVHAQELNNYVSAQISNDSDQSVKIDANYSVDQEKKELVVEPKDIPNFKPGKYRLSLKLRTLEGEVNIDQDFTWGVLAINTQKSIYRPGETVNLGMAVLDDHGKTYCMTGFRSARLTLSIISPSGKQTILSTDRGEITDSKQCGPVTVTNAADFQAKYQAQEAGIYQMHLEADTQNGTRSIDDYFKVEENPPFDITRYNFPTRIYPRAPYSVNFNINPQQNFSGQVEEVVPSSFQIPETLNNGQVSDNGNFKTIVWQVNLKKGSLQDFGYKIEFPDISPEFYLLGPIRLVDNSGKTVFEEARQWQIASDAISFVQAAHAISSGGASNIVSPIISAATAGDLLILTCGSNSAVTWTTPTGYTLVRHDSPGADQAVFYKIAAGGETTADCNQSIAQSETGTLMEYSSIENNPNTITPLETSNSASTCSPNTGSITTTQPDELLFVALLNTKSTTISSQTGYTERTQYQDTGGASPKRLTTSLGDNIVTTTGTRSASANSASAGSCVGQIVAFRANIDISLAGYRFFANANSLTPGSPLAANNSPLNLSSANEAFRLRIVLNSANYQSAASMRTYKLQEAPISSGSCGTYVDVTTSTNIAFNDNAAVADGATAVSATGDPRYEAASDTLETYEEANNFTNSVAAIPADGAGLFDFSLKDNTTQGTAVQGFCFRVVQSDDLLVDSYPLVPQVYTQPINAVVIQGGTTIQGGTQVLP